MLTINNTYHNITYQLIQLSYIYILSYVKNDYLRVYIIKYLNYLIL